MSDQREFRERVAELWNKDAKGAALEAGRLVFEQLPEEARPGWAAEILRLVIERSGTEPSRFARLLRIAENPTTWASGHREFDHLRRDVLKMDEVRRARGWTGEEELLSSLISLAELVAKVTYNAARPPDPFDEDSGWWIASSLRAFVNYWKDESFARAAWRALTHEPA